MENHIEIAKENLNTLDYAFRVFARAPKPPQRDRSSYGAMLKTAFEDTVSVIIHNRQEIGMDAENLLVLQLSSGEAIPNVETLQNKLHLAIVEEVKEEDGTMRFLVQFGNQDDIKVFEKERALWESDSPEDTNVLTYAQRRDLFACIEGIRAVSPEDRTGKRLSDAIANDTLPDGSFVVDIDVWFNGNISERNIIEGQIKKVLGTGGSTLLGDLFVLPNLLLGRVKVNRFTLEALRKFDLIAQVDYPIGVLSTEQCQLYSTDFVPTVDNTLDGDAPLACVIDSGIFSANPLLSNLIVAEEDFDLTENTTSDQNGHGTGVAGIVAYGSFENYNKVNQTFTPLVRLCNGKVTHNTPSGASEFPENKRPEQIVYDAICFFHEKYHCRVFNVSLGDSDQIYKGGRQLPWGSMIDKVSSELDIVVVVSAGNVNLPAIPAPYDRDDLMEKTRNQLLEEQHRIIDPATAALGVTVGSITRYEEPEAATYRTIPLSAGKENYPSVFTRTGEGVSGAIKPEFVDYGGNFALTQRIAGSSQWSPNRALNEPTLNNNHNPVFKGWHGTSFAAPHVTHIAARLQYSLQAQLGEEPSANLIRALLASSATFCKSHTSLAGKLR